MPTSLILTAKALRDKRNNKGNQPLRILQYIHSKALKLEIIKGFFLLLILFLPALLAAQTCDYDKLYREGKTFAKQRQYKKALYKFNSARRCDPTKGETVDAAIEALLDKVEGEKKTADKERERAELEKDLADKERERAEQALSELRQTSGMVVENLLRDAENKVYHLRYQEALEKMTAAAEIGQKKPEVARALMEIAYFYAESGQFSDAKDITILSAKLLGKEAVLINKDTTDARNIRRALRLALQSLDANRFAGLEARYYPVMIEVKGGRFIPGCGKGKDCGTLPYLKVSDFKMARTETTFWQFGLYTATVGLKIQDFTPQWGLDGDNPVVNTSWYQALEYANWASEQQNLKIACNIDSSQIIPNANGYRLPTEAEWEYAARGGIHHDPFLYSGSNYLDSVAWCYLNADTLGVSRTHPVSTRLPNSLGLHDMSGNAYEWCWDYDDIPMNLNYEDPGFRSLVLRGGSWSSFDTDCSVTSRHYVKDNDENYRHGFRLALN